MKPFFRTFLLSVLTIVPTTLPAQGVVPLDTVYTPDGYPDGSLSATIFIPSPAKAKGVGVVLGRYTNATRLTAKVWCDTLAAGGYVAMTIDYGNLDASFYPKPQRAFKTAVEFLRRNAARFGITRNRIVGFGQSQGSLIWGQTIIWDRDDSFFGTDPLIDDRLDAAVLLYGAYDMFHYLIAIQDTILRKHFSPNPSLRGTKGQCITNVATITTPVLLMHGSADQTVNRIHSTMLYDSLRAHGTNVKYVEFPGVGHVFDLASNGQFTQAGLQAKDTMLAFLGDLFKGTDAVTFSNTLPVKFVLHQNFPNPFNPTTTINYQTPVTSHVTLKVFDMIGRTMATLVDRIQGPGKYEARWNAAGCASGVYFYRLQTDGFTETKKLIVIR